MKAVMRKTLLAAVLAATAGQAMAAGDSIDVKVIGQIVPAACTANVTGGATVDYGTMKSSTLATDDFTMLDVKTLELSIACEAPVKIALKTQDMRSDSVVALTGKNWGMKASTVAANGKELGLGSADGKNIGAWAMWMEPASVKADGNAVDALDTTGTPNASSTWTKAAGGAAWLATTGAYKSWGATGTVTPVALTTLTGTLSVQAGINKASELDLTKPVTLDGLATLQVYYL
ncbi:DUF1120 domain-containing protein [Scandinavium sp.]|uniref:DUF1120 domain-containing protein n=1 Tax=Scandinavium sp. TaxID=2830653 RepID=UPI00289DE617|nr:DUF1120 domain-containing protein [Scandinavium sp.]